MSVFTSAEYDDHELIGFWSDAKARLRAIIAIHRTSELGIAGGGCRMWPYDSDDAAVRDALRLSQAMTYKTALADLASGGAKCVIIGDSRVGKSDELLRALGRCIDALGGRFVVAEDVGTTPADMEVIATETPYVAGRENGSGDTAPATARGVVRAIQAALLRRFGRGDLDGAQVAVQGLGGVGWQLAELLAGAGARLVVTDIDSERCDRAADELGAQVCAPDDIVAVEVDVLAPCALGDVIGPSTVPRLRCSVVAGSANNQLVDPGTADRLVERRILYVPDFVANMGGALGAATVRPTPERIDAALERIPEILAEVFSRADRTGVSTHAAAVDIAMRMRAERLRDRPPSKWMRRLWSTRWVARSALRARALFAGAR